MAKILLVEDDKLLAKTINKLLVSQNHAVDALDSGKEALEYLRSYTYDLIVLDWGLPELSGIGVCKEFRKSGGNTPILMLTGKGDILEKQEGFDAGVDDYLTKPFHIMELDMRLKALMRRTPQVIAPGDTLKFDDIEIDLTRRSVSKAGEPLKLLPREYALLVFFLKHPGGVFSSDALLDRVWQSDSDASPDSVRIHVTRLRRKLDDAGKPSLIETVHGVGYRLRSPSS